MTIRILVVEDNPSMQFALQAALEEAGYEITTATNGPRALQLFRESLPDLIILDIMMPGMIG